MNLRIAKSILSETTNIYPAQGSGLRSPRVLQPCVVPPSFPLVSCGRHRACGPRCSPVHVCLSILKPLATSAWRPVWQSLSTGNFLNLSDHHFQFHNHPSLFSFQNLFFHLTLAKLDQYSYLHHTHTCVARVCVCVRRLERTFEMRLKTVNSCKGYILGLRVMNAVSAQSQILESVLFD